MCVENGSEITETLKFALSVTVLASTVSPLLSAPPKRGFSFSASPFSSSLSFPQTDRKISRFFELQKESSVKGLFFLWLFRPDWSSIPCRLLSYHSTGPCRFAGLGNVGWGGDQCR